MARLALLLLTLAAAGAHASQRPAAPAPSSAALQADPPIACQACDEWNAPREPFKLFGNAYFVGVAGLSSVLVTSDAGHVLIDGGLPQSAPLIDANIRALGFRTEDVRLIVISHPHYDHVGGVAALQRASGATVAATAAAAEVLKAGAPLSDDPQYGLGRDANAFPAVRDVRVIGDGEVLRVGPLALTAHTTPGHTPGGTTWTWRSCEGDLCANLVYADSLTAVSAPGFRFSDGHLADTFRATIAKVAALPCDIIVAAHPGFTDLDGKLARRRAGTTPDPFIEGEGCRAYAAAAATRLESRLRDEDGAR